MMQAPKTATLIVGLICDDVRQEDNGKQMLIGIYTSEIIVSSLPANLNLVLWMLLDPCGITDLSFDLRVIGTQNQSLAKAKGVVKILDASKITSVSSRLPIQIQTTGIIRFQWKQLGGNDWENVREINVTTGPTLLSERLKKT